MKNHQFFLEDTGISKDDLKYVVNLLMEEGFNREERREVFNEHGYFLAYPSTIEQLKNGEKKIQDFRIPADPVVYN